MAEKTLAGIVEGAGSGTAEAGNDDARIFGKPVSRLVGGEPQGNGKTEGTAGGNGGRADAGAKAIDPVEVTKKRRGRPPGSGSSASAKSGRSETAGTGPEKEPFPKTVKRAVKSEVPSTMVEQVAQGIFGLHQMGAAVLAAPELMLSEAEAQAISASALNVAAWYAPIKAGASKWTDWGMLLVTLGLVYAPRIGQYRLRQAAAHARPVQASEQAQ